MEEKMQNKKDHSPETIAAIQEIEDFYRLFVENSREIFYKLNSDGFITFVSPACKHLLGYQVSDMEGHSFQEFIHPEDQPLLHQALVKFSETNESNLYFEYRIRHHNGDWRFYASDVLTLTDNSGEFIAFNGIARDITEAKRIEQALQKRAEISFFI